jgi:hypothetical protein
VQTEMKERIQDRLIREEQQEEQDAYSPKMSPAEIEAFLARLHAQEEAWDKEQREPTDSVKTIRKMRQERTNELMRRATNARRG